MRQNFKLTIRNLLKQRVNSLINLVGLTVAISSLMLILLWIREELSYDQFHKNVNQIYRIIDGNPAEKESFAGSPAPLGGFLKENFPEILSFTRFDVNSRIINVNNILFNENRVAAADTSFFNIFSFPLLRGIKNKVLQKTNSILLSESTAVRYFGTTDPLGKTLILDDSINYEITGIFKDIPANSHIHFDLITRFEANNDNEWGAWNYFTYILVNPNTDPEAFKKKTIQWAEKNDKDKLSVMNQIYYQPLDHIHFQFNRKNLEPTVEKTNIRAAILVAFLILIIACINFTNLSTIQSVERAKEIAVRKIWGESQHRLGISMAVETLLISFISLFLSVILVENLLPVFNSLLDSHIGIKFTDYNFILGSIGLVFITGILSGTYPAIILSSFRPLDLFRNSFKLKGKQSIRTVLVVAQFSISIILMICLFVINRQMEFVRSKKLGLNPENIVNIRLQSLSIAKHAKEIKEEFLKNPEVISASVNSYIPSQHNEHWGGIYLNERTYNGTNEDIGLWIIFADKDFLKTMQIDVLEGEELINHYTSPEFPFILNESAAALVKGDVVVGKEFEFWDSNKGRIIGIVKDFHFRSLHHQIEPTAIILYDLGYQISVRINSTDISSTLASLEKIWNRFSPDLKFDYYFLDEDFDQLYKSETKTSRLLMAAGILSMLLCCLGIYGIVTYSAKRRTKEIGIRKANGASATRIIAMLAKDYTWWIAISFIIACPISFLFMHNWLQNFAYKITLVWWLFVVAGVIAYLIALITAGWQSWRVANQNPAEALRYE
jgi:putative ABC transport system permease protein